MLKMLIKMLTHVIGGGRMVYETAFHLLSATTVVGIVTLLLASPLSAEVCSKKDAAKEALERLNIDGKVISVDYYKKKRGYWVGKRDYYGEIWTIFIERGDRC